MSNAASRVVHQDYIVRQRYSNALPPPPGAPKLLDLPNEGVSLYTMPLYASKMARSQPINIEADAFLGMPIDLVGMPGVFEGDESSIQAPLVPPAIDARDRVLLRPLKSLGKPKSEVSDISFLRRTQYTAEDRRLGSDVARSASGPALKRRKVDSAREEPTNILRSVIKGFDIANPQSAYKGPDTADNTRGHAASAAETEAWKHPKHPSKPGLKVLETYALLPDLEAAPDDGGYWVFKFSGNPSGVKTAHDGRMDVALLHQNERGDLARSEEQQARIAAHEADPAHHLYPLLPSNYDFFLPADARTAANMGRMLDPGFDEDEADELYTSRREGAAANDSFRFAHSREYESGHIVDSRQFPYQEVALVLQDGDGGGDDDDDDDNTPPRLDKGAYFYAINSKLQLKPRRNVKLSQQLSQEEEEEDKIDVVNVAVRDLNEDEHQMRRELRARLEVAAGS